MAKSAIRVKIDNSGLKKMLRSLLPSVLNPIITKMYKQWAVRYRRFSRRWFSQASRGGGQWPPLEDSTIRQRRHGGGAVNKNGQIRRISGGGKRGVRALRKALASGGGQVAILRDTGTLFGALDPVFSSSPGAREQLIRNGIEVGFGGPAKHPKGKATIADIASFHQFGSGNLPQREILVDPDTQTMSGMSNDADRAMAALIVDSDIGGAGVA